MVKHIVCFKLLDRSEASKMEAKNILLSMEGKVSPLESIEVGVDFLGSPRSYDIILTTTFKTKSDLDAYQINPYHVNVVKAYMHSHVETSIAVDYEF